MEEKKIIQNITIIGLIIFIVSGGVMVIVFRNFALNLAGILIFGVGLTGFLIVIKKERFLPLPLKLKRWILINIIFTIEVFVAKILKIDVDLVMRYFIFLNNRINVSLRGKMLLLLPRCLQNSKCSQDIMSDIQNCKRCGDCQISDVLLIAKPDKVAITVVGGGRRALEKVKEIAPDSVIAVACEKELIDGIKEIQGIPVLALENLRPNGPCLNTGLDIERLKEIFEGYE